MSFLVVSVVILARTEVESAAQDEGWEGTLMVVQTDRFVDRRTEPLKNQSKKQSTQWPASQSLKFTWQRNLKMV